MAADLEEGDGIRTVVKVTTDSRVVLRQIGAFLVAKSNEAFKRQKLGTRGWQARLVPNVPGIVSDLNRGALPPARRFQPRPALIDTGTLRRSVTFRVVNQNTVEVGSSLPYAGVHQNGGVTSITLSKTGARLLSRFLAKRTDLQESLGFLFSKPDVVRNVPARPFVGVPDDASKEIEAIIAGEVNR